MFGGGEAGGALLTHPWVEGVVVVALLAGIPLALVAAGRVLRWWRGRLWPESRVGDLPLSAAEAGLFVGVLVLLVLGTGMGMHVAAGAWVLGFMAWKGVDARALWNWEWRGRTWWRDLLAVVPTYLALLPVVGLGVWVSLMWGQAMGWQAQPQKAVLFIAETESGWQLAGMLVLACVVAPLVEEMVFRGWLYPALKTRCGRGLALGVSGLAFGAIHGEWAYFLSLSFLGVVLAWVYDQSGRLSRAVVLHMVFNTSSCAVLLASRVLPEA